VRTCEQRQGSRRSGRVRRTAADYSHKIISTISEANTIALSDSHTRDAQSKGGKTCTSATAASSPVDRCALVIVVIIIVGTVVVMELVVLIIVFTVVALTWRSRSRLRGVGAALRYRGRPQVREHIPVARSGCQCNEQWRSTCQHGKRKTRVAVARAR
jgi:hypothetical protein